VWIRFKNIRYISEVLDRRGALSCDFIVEVQQT
jgi:hypothetical protein